MPKNEPPSPAAPQADAEQPMLFRHFLESSSQALGMASLPGRIVYANTALAGLLGVHQVQDLYHSEVFEFYEATEAARLKNEILPVVLREGQWTGELDLREVGGGLRPTLQNIFLVRDPCGTPLCLANVITEIAERVCLEQTLYDYRDHLQDLVDQRTRELDTSNALLRERIEEQHRSDLERRRLIAILDSTTDLVATANPNGQVLFLNAAGHYLLGLDSHQRLQGLRMADAHPAWAWRIVEQEGIPTAVRDGVWRGQTAIRDRSGFEIPVSQVIMAHRDATGRLEYISTIMRDISERRRAEEALHTWMRRYDFLVEASGQVVYEYLIASQEIIWGNSLEKVLGYRQAEMDGGIAQWVELIHPDDRQATLALLNQAEQACTAWDTRYRLRHRAGHYVWVRDRGYFLPDCDGRAERQLGLVEDISGLIQAEEARRESELRFSQAFRYSPSMMGITTFDQGRFIEVNDRFLKNLGYDRSEVIGHTATELNYFVDEGDRAALLRELKLNGKLEDYEYRFRDKQGAVHWALAAAAEIEIDGQACILTQILDITGRKRADQALAESEARLKEAQHLAQLGYWAWDIKTGQIEWSPELYRIFGLEPASFTPSLTAIKALSPWPEDNARDQELIRCAMESRERGSYEQRFLRPDKSIGHYVSSFQGKYDESGRLVTIVGAIQDITERKRLEENFRQAQKMETIGRLAGGVAHDFNNILTAIAGNAELALLNDELDPKTASRLREIELAAASAARLTKQLLAFSRKQIIKPEVLDLNDLIRNMGRMLERVIGEDICLRTLAQPGLNCILADPGQLQQVIMNLAVNARDAMPQGGILTIETANATLGAGACLQTDLAPGEYVMLAVSDTGCGMDAEVKQHLFEPFFTTKEAGKGTGLGLATVYGAVSQNHGAIQVYSEPDQGSCFKIYLPTTAAVPDATAATSCPLLPCGSETILLTEDDPMVRDFVSGALAQLGYQVLVAASGAEALQVAGEFAGRIDLLLTDVVMPGLNGRQLAELLRTERADLRVLFASGYTQDAIVHQGVLEPNLDFIGKPFSTQNLARKLREVLERA